ncbi:alpha/beta fold hydrolase [uncultured Tyzzerella sp.]|uniref:alpha/beta hydrolase n=1 Tax=uncultured Tyzzerella sp. TaxID=2321398 RepID=UPI002942CB5A|nr:alpha/beta fold hydrolase [uncultured Tyzzerella sp.]
MNNLHKQTYKHIDTSDTVIIFIHGFTESPSQFLNLINIALNNGFSYLNLLLPGHGTTSKEFSKNGYKKWTRYVDKHIEEMQKIYKNIILVGHSMGCLLAINAHLKNRYNIKGIFCINIPFNIRVDFKTFISGVKIALIPNYIKDDFTKEMKDRTSISNKKILLYPFWIPRYIDLFYLSYKIYFNIKNIKVPTIYLQSYYDGLVSIKSAISIKKKLKKYNIKKSTIIILKNSGHFGYDKEDKKIVEKSFLCFIKKYNV